jgi:hypothetical protein
MANADLEVDQIAHRGASGAVPPLGGVAARTGRAAEAPPAARTDQLADALDLLLRARRALDQSPDPALEAAAERAIQRLQELESRLPASQGDTSHALEAPRVRAAERVGTVLGELIQAIERS